MGQTSVVQWVTIGITLLALLIIPFGIVGLEMSGLYSSLPPTVFAVFAMVPALLLRTGSLLVMLGSR